jgi:hypothetical protein
MTSLYLLNIWYVTKPTPYIGSFYFEIIKKKLTDTNSGNGCNSGGENKVCMHGVFLIMLIGDRSYMLNSLRELLESWDEFEPVIKKLMVFHSNSNQNCCNSF